MDLSKIPTGPNPPEDVNVVVEVPLGGEPIKYEIDKASGALFVDRFLYTPMRYPGNYGFIPHTLCGDGDPLDVLVMTPMPLVPRSVINCRPIGYLEMKDEAGSDEKLIAVPNSKISPLYKNVHSIRDLADPILDQIAHFFQHYKDLEKGKWVKIEGWHGPKDAQKAVLASIERFQSTKKKPNF